MQDNGDRRSRTTLDGDWLQFEVVTVTGRAAAIRVRVHRDFVEVWRDHDHCSGVLDRDQLRDWLDAMPRQGLVVDEVGLSIDRMVDTNGRVAISLPDVVGWTLSPTTLNDLHRRI